VQRAQKKMLDVLNSVGMGESVLRMIERRHRADVYLALGGMVRVIQIATDELKLLSQSCIQYAQLDSTAASVDAAEAALLRRCYVQSLWQCLG
jgi:hypothetical protein